MCILYKAFIVLALSAVKLSELHVSMKRAIKTTFIIIVIIVTIIIIIIVIFMYHFRPGVTVATLHSVMFVQTLSSNTSSLLSSRMSHKMLLFWLQTKENISQSRFVHFQ